MKLYLLTYLPFFISFAIGALTVNLLLQEKEKYSLSLRISFSGLLGLGISALIVYAGFIFLNRYHRTFIISINLLTLLTLIQLNRKIRPNNIRKMIGSKIKQPSNLAALFVFFLLFLLCWIQANFYPHGGWDAWSTWNFKAKFLFLSGADWKNIFDPLLWRSSPQYPLLLPCINIWGWTLIGEPAYQVPLFTSVCFTLLCSGVLFGFLKRFTNTYLALLSVTSMLTIELFIKMATSQYCDIVVAVFLLTAFACLLIAKMENDIYYSILGGIFTGLLSFSKSEGYIIAGLIMLLSVPYFLLKNKSAFKFKLLGAYLITSLLALIPTIIFILFLAPENITFTNGLTSTSSPSTTVRLQTILIFYLFKFKSAQWGYIWIGMLIGLLFSLKKCFSSQTIIIPAFLVFYSASITFYYFLNTNFEIIWWLQVTLDRLMSVVLPALILWIIFSVNNLNHHVE